MSAAQAGWRRLSRAGQPTVFNIPASVPFVDALAQGLLTDAGDDPLALAAVTVLLPTRRAARSLREAFLRLTQGDPLLLPRMMILIMLLLLQIRLPLMLMLPMPLLLMLLLLVLVLM